MLVQSELVHQQEGELPTWAQLSLQAECAVSCPFFRPEERTSRAAIVSASCVFSLRLLLHPCVHMPVAPQGQASDRPGVALTYMQMDVCHCTCLRPWAKMYRRTVQPDIARLHTAASGQPQGSLRAAPALRTRPLPQPTASSLVVEFLFHKSAPNPCPAPPRPTRSHTHHMAPACCNRV
jgi:hypothetical protein